MGRISKIAFAFALLSLLVAGGSVSSVWARQNDRELFDSGRDCREQLLASPAKQKYRIQWERCIRPYEQLVSWYPESPLADDALFMLGDLYRGLSGYSGSSSDRNKGTSYHKQLIERYPESSFSEKVRAQPGIRTESPKATVENIRHMAYPEYTRLVLDLDRAVDYRTEQKADPASVIVILPNTRLGDGAKSRMDDLNTGLFKWVELDAPAPSRVELSVQLDGAIESPKIAMLSNPDRLVIDLYRKSEESRPSADRKNPSAPKITASLPPPVSIRTIVIDPGHGGKDPGAIGRGGLTEKEVVLDIGRRLRTLIESNLGKRVIMTRDRDEFISLNDRASLANREQADLFISVHANSHPKRSTRGVEIYLLGQSTDKRALTVAARENSVSEESMGDLDKTVQQILFDLGTEYKIDQSFELADSARHSFLRTFAGQYRYEMADLRVKQAPFYVLLHSDMPGILAEVSYISNSTEESLLRKDRYRQALAETLFEAVRRYISSLESIS